MPSVTGIVLCGGRSTRMGHDKAALRFGHETMLQRMVRIVGEATDHVIVVGRGDSAFAPAATADTKSRSICLTSDPVEDLGPLAGIAQGLRTTTTDLNFIVACDMPLLRVDVIRRLIDLAGESEACVPVDGETVMVLCGVYRKHLADQATRLLNTGQRRARALLEHVNTKRIDAAVFRDIDPDLESFFSCDTPEAYEAAVVRAGLA